MPERLLNVQKDPTRAISGEPQSCGYRSHFRAAPHKTVENVENKHYYRIATIALIGTFLGVLFLHTKTTKDGFEKCFY